MLKGYGKVGFQLDSRLSTLHGLIQAAPVETNSPEDAALLKAMCSLAFYARPRVAEITFVLSNKSDVPLQLAQLTRLVDINNKVAALKIVSTQLQTQLQPSYFFLDNFFHGNFGSG